MNRTLTRIYVLLTVVSVSTMVLDAQEYSLPGSISSVSGEDLVKTSSSYPSWSLYGKIPGLVVEDYAERVAVNVTPNFYVRGKSTFGNASNIPLVVVDGFIRNIDDININDIESVSVLKDAVSTAMYGMQGANGVIYVTTRRGASAKPQYRVEFEQGFQTPLRIPDFAGSARYAQAYNEALVNDGMTPVYGKERIAAYLNAPGIYNPDNQWQDLLVRRMAPTTKVNLSSFGGNESVRYYVSLGYRNDNGLFAMTDTFSDDYDTNLSSDKFYVKTNIDLIAVENLELKLDISGQINVISQPRKEYSDLWRQFYTYPQHEFPMLLPDGSIGGTPSFTENPYGTLNASGYRRNLNRHICSSLTGKYNFQGILEGLSIGARYAYDNMWLANEYWDRTFAVHEIKGQNADGSPILSMRGVDGELTYRHANTDDSQRRRENLEAFMGYDRCFGETHDVGAYVVYHQDNLTTDNSTPYRNQYVSGRVSWSISDRYSVEAALSYSGSEAFAKQWRYALYPAVALGWNISNEKFLKDHEWIERLRLRTSAGYSGNSNQNARFAYRQQTLWTGGAYHFGLTPDSYGSRELGTEANVMLRPEKSFKADAGIDGRIFKCLDFGVTGFYERRSDILTDMNNLFSGVSGLKYPNTNLGSTTTYGVEFSANFERRLSSLVTMFADFNLLWYRNRIDSMLEQPLPLNSAYQYQTGKHIGASLALVAEGLFRSQDEIDNSPLQQFGAVAPGDIRYKDVNKDGYINDYDRVYTDAYPVPNTEMGLTLGFRFGDFDVSAFFHATSGTEIYMGDASAVYWPFANNSYRLSRYVAERTPWTPDKSMEADYPKLSTASSVNNNRRSTFWLVDGDRLRLRNLEIGYVLPERVSKKIMARQLRFYLRGINLFTLDHLKELDPAALTGTPMLRSYYFGLSFTF